MSAPVLWSAAEAADATGGRTMHDWAATGVSIDSRGIVPGDLFIALKGPNHDGHDHAAAALTCHAAAAVVEIVPDGLTPHAPLLMVEDTAKALESLARAARARSAGKIIAVTGSVGKTGTKEMLRLALGGQASATASAGNLNNHIGVPLSLARLPRDAVFGVFEIGMNHPGEIGPLARLAKPHIAVITTIEPVHMAAFASLEALADAKAEIFEGMDHEGIAVLNRDNPLFFRLAAAARHVGIERIFAFGESEDAIARLIDLRPQTGGSRITAEIDGRSIEYELQLAGHHWALNSVAVLATVLAAGADPARAAASLGAMAALSGRGEHYFIEVADGNFELIDESYNASPAAMRAAFKTLAESPVGPGGRRLAVLGDMLELGARASDYHAALAETIDDAGIDLVFTAGRHIMSLRDALPPERRGGHGAGAGDLVPLIVNLVRPGDVVLVKGSLGIGMGRIVAALRAMQADRARKADQNHSSVGSVEGRPDAL